MGTNGFEITFNVIKMVAIFLMMVQMVPVLVWAERRVSAFIQNRLGPNRTGPLGLMQLAADAIKFLFKEPFTPANGNSLMYYGAPVIALIPGALAFAAIPLSTPLSIAKFTLLGHEFGPGEFVIQGYDLGIGIVFVLGISSLGAYALLTAGWGSGNKYSLLGALRASAQMVSYELALSLSLVGVLMIYGTFYFSGMVQSQMGPLIYHFGSKAIPIGFFPAWGIFYQPLGALIFFAATFAETNRLPFDLPESEGELVAGFHTEYGGFSMLLFFLGEYGHMMVASALLITFYFGGYALPYHVWTPEYVHEAMVAKVGLGNFANILTSLVFFLSMMVKIIICLFVFIWVRWTLPRFRYDQLMNLGWKTMLPWALANTVITAIVIALCHQS